MLLIAGLGNPGVKYQYNRHNLGFMVVDELISHYKATNSTKTSFRGELFKQNDTYFLKPMTYMNLSGESILAVKNYFKLDTVIVIYDDLDLPYGSIRYKIGGGSGGHNGLKSCDTNLKTNYIKIRLGIGRPKNSEDVVEYVLGDFSKKELECIKNISNKIIEALECFREFGFDKMTSLHSIKKTICKEGL